MDKVSSEEIETVLNNYQTKLKKELGIPATTAYKPIVSREYTDFKKDNFPKALSFYEKACNISAKIMKVVPNPKKVPEIIESLNTCHLETTPEGVTSVAFVGPILFILIGLIISFGFFRSMFLAFFFLITAIVIMVMLEKLPLFLANNWRLQASNQMVLSVFYVVTFMRHTSNLENAIDFAAEHLSGPLSLDLKKILWNVETQQYASVKESLDVYLETWRKWNNEFVESFHLIESSLYESSEDRRISLLEKSLEVILEETYEKMLHYAQNLKSPITMLHMLGIILPILGLVILPLVVAFMSDVKWWHISLMYNVGLPIIVYYLTKTILATRPTGYGDTDISEENESLKKYRNIIINIGKTEIRINPIILCSVLGGFFLLLGMSPILLHLVLPADVDPQIGEFKLLGYRKSTAEGSNGEIVGPYGIGSTLLSLCIPLGLAISIGLYFKLRSKNIIKIRDNTKKLEAEFASALFQLGNRLGDGIPTEIAFQKVSDSMADSVSGNFFRLVATNMTRMGMSVKEAIFDSKTGALTYFPSKIIESSMKVLIESSKKGPRVAAQALMNVSQYIKEIHRVNERLKDLLADIISSMKSQINFLTPVIAGIVIGITSMITMIIGKLTEQMASMGETSTSAGGMEQISSMFGDGIPTYHFQIIVGVYVIQIIYILTILSNGVENGSDKLNERYLLGVYLFRSPIMYIIVALIIILIFNSIAAGIMGEVFSSA